jgi:hypothetical protein
MSCRKRETVFSMGRWMVLAAGRDGVSTFRAYLSRKLSCLYFIIGDSR